MKCLVFALAMLLMAPAFSQIHGTAEISTPSNAAAVNVVGKPSAYAVKTVDFNGPGMDFSPFPYRDGIVFVSSRPRKEKSSTEEDAFLNLFFTSENEDGSFSTPVPLETEIISPYHEGPVVFFADETKRVVTRNAFIRQSKVKSGSVSPLELAMSGLLPSGNWSEPVALPFVSPSYSVGHPAMSADGKTLYFSSNMPGTVGESDLFVSRLENGVWTQPVNLGRGINTSGKELFPFVYRDSLLFFASNGHGGMGGLDIFYCNLRSHDLMISTFPYPVNSTADDFGIFLEQQGASGFFSSNREGGRGNDDIYYFEEVQPFVEVQLYDSLTHRSVTNGWIELSGPGRRMEIAIDAFGKTVFRIRPLASTLLSIHAPGYGATTRTLTATDFHARGVNRIPVYLSPLSPQSINMVTGLSHRTRSGLSNVISFDSSPLDIDIQQEVPVPSPQAEAINTSRPVSGLKVIAVEVINDLPALMFVRDDLIYEFSASSESTLRNSALDLDITIPHGAKRHDYEEIIRKQMDAQGHFIDKFLLIRSFFFDSGKDWVRNDASAQLDKIVEIMVAHSEIRLQMTFHADSRGTDVFNLELSKARAEAVMAYLGKAGIIGERIQSRFVGESQPLNDCGDLSDCDELVHQINRTAEFKFLLR